MARENQGLQIALIVFVMLALILGVTTFVFYRQYDQEKGKALAADQEKAKVSKDLDAAQREIVELKRILGFGASDTMQVIGQEVPKDMQLAASLPEADRNYRKLVQHLNDTIQKKNQALAVAENDKANLQKQLADREREAAARIQQHEEEVKKAGADLNQMAAAYKKTESELNAEKDKLLTERKEIEDKSTQQIKSLQDTLAAKDKEIKTARDVAVRYRDEAEALQHTTFEIAHGKILWVNQRTGRVYVNLGEADGLRRLMTFGVFTSSSNDVSQSEKKASIEIIEILGPHMSEARITDDKPGNPVVPGDLVFTPIWAPGRRIHIALAGFIDIDNDGRSDLERVRGIITTNGAVVDAYQDESGKVIGQVTRETNYLVVGTPPDEKSTREMRRGYTEMINAATRNLVRQIKIDELFQRMGYRDVDRVTSYGKGASPNQFRPKAPPEGLPVSSGNISPLFQPRQPQRGSKTTF